MFSLVLATLTLFFAGTDTVMAEYVKFVPPNDPTGFWYTNGHDSFVGRGVVFQMSADTTIDSVGIGRGWGGSLQISEVASLGPNLETGAKILRTSLGLIPTEQSYWLNYPMTPLLLQKGHDYHIEFIGVNGVQSFFYNWQRVPFTVGNFMAVHGTYDGFTYNDFLPEIQVHVQDVAAAPEPSSLLLLGIGVLGMVGFRLRNRKTD
jgi:hypothetical protein